MKAIILAAGLGSRLGLEDIPKPMYKIKENPILEHNILLLKKHNVKEICINLHYKPEVIKNYFSNGEKWEVTIHYSYEKKLLGTSGAVKNVEWFWDKEPFFVIYGDNFTNINLTDMYNLHAKNKGIATIAIFNPKNNINCNILGSHIKIDQSNNLISFIEGNWNNVTDNYVNSGVYVLSPEILNFIPKGKPSDFGKNIFPKLLKKGKNLKGYITDSYVIAIDTKKAMATANEIASKGNF